MIPYHGHLKALSGPAWTPSHLFQQRKGHLEASGPTALFPDEISSLTGNADVPALPQQWDLTASGSRHVLKGSSGLITLNSWEKKKRFPIQSSIYYFDFFFQGEKKGVFKEFGAEDNIYPSLTNLPFKE